MGLPSRHLTFVISFDAPLELAVLPDGSHRPTRFDAMVGGFHTTPAVIRHDGSQHGIQLALTPAGPAPCSACRPPSWPRRSCRSTTCGAARPASWSSAWRRDRWRERFAVLDGVLLRPGGARRDPVRRAAGGDARRGGGWS